MNLSFWPKTKLEMRTGTIFGSAWGGIAFFFTLPLLFSDSVTITSDIGLIGEATAKTAPGWTFALPLMLFALFFGTVAFHIGVKLRRNRQLTLLGASNPLTPQHLRQISSGGFYDRWVFRLAKSGLDADVNRGPSV